MFSCGRYFFTQKLGQTFPGSEYLASDLRDIIPRSAFLALDSRHISPGSGFLHPELGHLFPGAEYLVTVLRLIFTCQNDRSQIRDRPSKNLKILPRNLDTPMHRGQKHAPDSGEGFPKFAEYD